MKTKNKVGIAVCLVALAALISFPFLVQGSKIIQVQVQKLGMKEIHSYVTVSGTLDSAKTQSISFTSQNTVEKLNVKQGQRVKKDEVIAEIALLPSGLKQEVKAEFDGVVTTLNMAQGQLTTLSQPAAVIKSEEEMLVKISVNQYDYSRLRQGLQANISFNGHSYEGVVDYIAASAETVVSTQGESTYAKAEIKISNPDENLILGFEANCDILTASEENALVIPYEAVKTDKQGQYCYVLAAGNHAKKVYFEAGISSDSYIQVVSGLQAEDSVILNPSEKVEDGKSVIPV